MNRFAYIGLAATLFAAPALARDNADKVPPPEVFQAVIDCRGIANPQERLACYDGKVAALAGAQASKELFVASKEEVRKTKRGLFGLTVPDLNIFGSQDGQQVDSITSTIRSARTDPRGRYVLDLAEGGRWMQIDNEEIGRPKPGDGVEIRKAALGSFIAKVDNDRAFRVRRLNE